MNELGKVFQPFYKALNDKVKASDFLIDKSGVKIVELLAPRIEIPMSENEEGFIDFESKKAPRKYCAKEHDWYTSKDLSINQVSDVQIWNQVADSNKEINSNYGYLVYSKGNFAQFSHALETLKKHKDSRQAIVIYTRPSIQLEHNDLGGADFICTIDQHFFIRNNKLMCVTDMRSNDCIFGTFNDIPWFASVYQDMYKQLKETYPELEYGSLVFIPHSFHCYERHFELLEKIAGE